MRDAETALDVVLEAIVRHVDADTAEQIVARLPVALRGRLRELPAGPDPASPRHRAEERIARELDVRRARRSTRVPGSTRKSLTLRKSRSVGDGGLM
jgi:uncharacterized protein (DUF2267 family)